MVGERKSVEVRNQIFELYDRGIGKKKIAQALGISKNTVTGIVRRSEESGGALGAQSGPLWSKSLNWDDIKNELTKRYTTIKVLHQEFAPPGISYLRFYRELCRRVPKDLAQAARIRFHYEPGKRLEIDYCDGIDIVDRVTGTRARTHLFAAVSSSSDYVYGEFAYSQRQEDFLRAHDRMFHFYGGVFENIVTDNLKGSVHRAHIYDPDVNATYVDYANHMGFVVLPARPATPRDKPTIEATIGVIQRQFYAEVRNHVFYSLTELNERFKVYLETLNTVVMKDCGVSRSSRFSGEKLQLKALPVNAFEIAIYKTARVHPDCHV